MAAGVSFAVVKATDDDPRPISTSSGVNSAVPTSTGSTSGSGTATPSGLAGSGLDLRSLIDKARPSVVSVSVYGSGLLGRGASQPLGAGSGVIVSADGLVLTNDHVISAEGADVSSITVKLSDGKTYDATVVGSSPSDDLALLQLENASGLTAAELGDSDSLQVGDEVVAIGNALDLGDELTVTRGIASAKNRTVEEPTGASLVGLIQTDAAINPGNSGGALFNAAGEVIGIPTAVSGNAQNIGYAIPSNRALALLDDLKKGGIDNPDAGFLGVSAVAVSQLSPAQREQVGAEESTKGVVVTVVTPGGAAEEAGIEEGDIIVTVAGKTILSQGDLGLAIRSHAPGESIDVSVLRDGKSITLKATLGSRPTS
ncbi:MAG: S1C family serine protease [Acidimicrobiia bacterium]